MVWFCSDNGATGPGSTGGLRGKKGSVWEGGVRVPGIIEWPARIRKSSTTDVPVVTSDIYPTLLDLLGVKVPNQIEPLDGLSVVSLLDGKMTERPRPIGFWHGGGAARDAGHAAWTDNRYKLHKFKANQYDLYDLVADPNEQKDLATEKPEIVARMKANLDAWQESVMKSNRGEDYRR
jgi:arylsulfatase A-like enzyme